MNNDTTCIPGEATGTWPDYLANCTDQKNEEPLGENFHGNREILVE